jgi:hypothetical protein
MENGRRAPLLYRNIRPASNSMANSEFVNTRNAMRLNMFLFHYSFTKTSKEGGWWQSKIETPPNNIWETV